MNKVASIDNSNTILTMLLAFIILGQHITGMKIICMFIMGTGIILMTQQNGAFTHQEESGNHKWVIYDFGSAFLQV